MRRLVSFLFALLLVVSLFSYGSTAQALSGDDFQAGRIIDDALFFRSPDMSRAAIQKFLDAKVPDCDTNHARSSSSNDPGPPYTCLKDYDQNTPSRSAESGLCGAISAHEDRSAANIIYDVSNACGISPKVLIVLLQKEQGLVTDDWPWPVQYQKATGFSCSDSAPCDPEFSGFFYQVYYAARQFKKYAKFPSDYTYKSGRSNSIQWNPDQTTSDGDRACGSSNVYIRNQATAGLYIYTPYRPNRPALDNLYGTGNDCSSYGNRNFWRYFNDWFGSTYLNFKKMDTPRWMVTTRDVHKKNPLDNEAIGPLIPEGTELYFDNKVDAHGSTYLRTRFDTDNYNSEGIRINDLAEVPLSFDSMETPRWMQLKKDSYKKEPRTEAKSGAEIPDGQQIFFASKITVGGKLYLRTSYDETRDDKRGILMSDLEDTSVGYADMEQPRRLVLKTDSKLYDIRNSEFKGSNKPKGTILWFNKKITVNNKLYLSNGIPSDPLDFTGYSMSLFSEFNPKFVALDSPRALRLKSDTTKENVITKQPVGSLIPADTALYSLDKIYINNTLYLRTLYDTRSNNDYVIAYSKFEEIPLTFHAMADPRYLTTKTDVHKRDPVTGQEINKLLPAGTKIYFTSKIEYNGTLYLRTKYDTNQNLAKGIRFSDLQ